jgi:hypothetical protein
MNKFTQPEKYSGKQLIEELKAAGIKIEDGQYPSIDGNGDFWLPVANKDVAKAEAVVAAHVGIDPSIALNARRQAILDKLGITKEEAEFILA